MEAAKRAAGPPPRPHVWEHNDVGDSQRPLSGVGAGAALGTWEAEAYMETAAHQEQPPPPVPANFSTPAPPAKIH